MAERACLDAVFLADNQCVRSAAPQVLERVAQYVANLEPFTLLAALAAVTSKIGLICTASTSFNYPFQLARKFASLDYISGGRVGWNIVTSGMPEEAANFGLAEHYEHSVRYARAAEFVDVCTGLWDSWEDGAFPRDKASGEFLIPSAMHTLGHQGTYFRVKGPLNVPRSPQGYPVFVQAGSSPAGTEFAARRAEMVFVTPQSLEAAQTRYAEVKRLAFSYGRDPEHVKVMPGLVFIVAETLREAEEDYDLLQSLLHFDVALSMLAMKMGNLDLSPYSPDAPLPRSLTPPAPSGGARDAFDQWIELGEREGLTLRELALRASMSYAGKFIYGSPRTIADMMEEWLREGGADGFNLQPAYLPGQFHSFVELLLPELRRRRLVRTAYDGTTLRDHFGLPRPAWRPHPQPAD